MSTENNNMSPSGQPLPASSPVQPILSQPVQQPLPAPAPKQAQTPSKNTKAYTVAIEYARLQGYMEGYTDQLNASKNTQEELIAKFMSDLAEMLKPVFAE